MKIGIIVAMSKELRLLLPLLKGASLREHDGVSFHTGEIGGHRVAVMQCGIGKVNAALGARAMIDAMGPELLINTGVAGGASASVGRMDVVVGSRVGYHDVWCGPGTDEGVAAGCPAFFTPPERVLGLRSLDGVKKGLIASGDRFIASREEITRIREIYPDVLAVDMESAAIAQACFLSRVPMVAIRVISDSPSESDDNSAQYNDFWEAAPEAVFTIVEQMLQEL